MLEELFNSKTRVKILSLFFRDDSTPRYMQEVIRLTGMDAANVYRELTKLERLRVVNRQRRGNRAYFSLNRASPYCTGLRQLFSPSQEHAAAPSHTTTALPQRKGISPESEKLISGKEWYHQRFDGSPLFIGTIAEAELKREERKPAGTEANVRACFFSEGKADWYLDMADVRRGANAMTELARKDPRTSEKLLARWKRDEFLFERFFWKEFPVINLKTLSDNDLVSRWNAYWHMAVRRLSSSAIIDHFALGTDETIRNLLRKEVYASRVGKKLKESQFTEIFATATAPIHLSFINFAEIDLLKIATGTSNETLAQYRDRHFWITNNYVRAEVLPIAYFKKELRAWQLSKKNLSVELKRIQDTPRRNLLKKQELFRRFSFSSELRTLIRISEAFSWWQDERKKATYFNIHIGTTMLGEVARRTGYETELLKYCVASEIPQVLAHRRPTMQDLRQRHRGCVYVATRDGYVLETGKRVEEIRRVMLGNVSMRDVQDIRGLSACLGRAVGTVKIVQSATEIGKVQKGDVLVAVMTRPDYVPAMRKAAAIVTNEGGVTSHAAIVSRELGVPCIIGTKIATEVFKDGDVVEVNANHGWVRKVQQ